MGVGEGGENISHGENARERIINRVENVEDVEEGRNLSVLTVSEM